MRNRSETVLAEILPPEERLIEAVVARYQRVAPAVTRFARSLSGNTGLQVRLGSRAAARPGEVVLDPGLFQAAYARSAPVTPDEVALAAALHEVVHLAVTDLDEQRPIPPSWLPPGDDPPPPDQAVPLLDALGRAGGPAAEVLFLALEDARQEARYLGAYRGARSVLADLYVAAVPASLAAARPLGQFALGCFLLVGGYIERHQLERRVRPDVALAVDDAAPFLERAAATEDRWEVAGSALELLQIARLHGLINDAQEDETIAERADREDGDRSAIADGVDAVRLLSPILADVESYDRTRKITEAVAGESGRKGESEIAGDPATEQIIRVSEAPTIYPPIGASGRLLVTPIPARFASFGSRGRTTLEEAARRWGVAQRRVSGELWPLFIANQRRGLRSGFDAGDLSPYAALFLGAGLYQRMFERRQIATRRSYAVSLLVDGSASMLQPRLLPDGRRAPWGMAAATLGAWTLARLADELQIEFEVALFNRAFAARIDDTEKTYLGRLHRTQAGLRRSQGGGADRLTRTVNHYVVKAFGQPWRTSEETLAGLFFTAAEPVAAAAEATRYAGSSPPVSMFEKAANVDEFNVEWAAERLAGRRASTRILVVLADGMTRGSVEALAGTVQAVEHSGTLVLGIGIGDGTVQAAYSHCRIVDRPDTLALAMVDGVRSSLRRSLALWGGGAWWTRTHTQEPQPTWSING